jgi:acyl carrier protein
MESGIDPLDLEGVRAKGVAKPSVREAVRQIVGEHGRLGIPVNQLADSGDLYAAGLTSLATVGLMLALEEAFDVEFPDAMLSRRTFASIDVLTAAIEKLRAA